MLRLAANMEKHMYVQIVTKHSLAYPKALTLHPENEEQGAYAIHAVTL